MDKVKFRVLIHDITNELTGLSAFIQLQNMEETISVEMAGKLEKKLRNIIDTVRTLSKTLINTDTKIIKISKKELVHRIQSVLDECKLAYKNVGFSPVGYHGLGESPILISEEDNVKLIVEEIVRNAVKAGATRITTHISERPEVVRVFLQDNGNGMSTDKRELINLHYLGAKGVGGEGVSLIKELTRRSGEI